MRATLCSRARSRNSEQTKRSWRSVRVRADVRGVLGLVRTRDQIRRVSRSGWVVGSHQNDGSRSRSDEFASFLDGGKEGGSVGLERDGGEGEKSHQHVVVEVAAFLRGKRRET